MTSVFGVIHECACGRRFMRSVLDLADIESGQAHCPCARLLGEWHGPQRLLFEPEDAPPGPVVH